jgi:hypothetical protein
MMVLILEWRRERISRLLNNNNNMIMVKAKDEKIIKI